MGVNNKMADTAALKESRICGNFELGDCFTEVKCKYGHEIRIFNISRGHYAACDKCRTFIFLGSNLMSNWREENEGIWQLNYKSIKDHKEIIT